MAASQPSSGTHIELRNSGDSGANFDTLKQKIGEVESGVDLGEAQYSKEIGELQTLFESQKEQIKFITANELKELLVAIKDENETLDGKLKVDKTTWELLFEQNSSPAIAPETSVETPPPEPKEQEVIVATIESEVPETYQKEVKQYIANNSSFMSRIASGIGNWIKNIIDGIKEFFMTFGIEDEWEKKDVLAQIKWFEDAADQQRVEKSVQALKTSAVLKWPPLGDILRMSHISREDLTEMMKQHPELDFSTARHIDIAFTGKYKIAPGENRDPLRPYERIFLSLKHEHDRITGALNTPYNARELFSQILEGSTHQELDSEIENGVIMAWTGASAASIDEASGGTDASLEVIETPQDFMKQAQDLDAALSVANALPEWTPEDATAKEEAKKTAEKNLEKFNEERKNSILTMYENVEKRLADKKRDVSVLERDASKTEELEKVRAEVKKLETIKVKIETEINTVLQKNGERWEIKPDTSAEMMVKTEITISNIESNITIIEQITLAEEEQKNQEKIIDDLETEVTDTLYGKDRKEIDNPVDITALEKKIADNKSRANTDELKEKVSWMEQEIKIAKLKVEAVKAFLIHARWLVDNEWEIPDYKGDTNDFIHLEEWGYLDINTISIAGGDLTNWTTWSDERWDLSPAEQKIAEWLGGKQEFVNVIKANTDWLKKNEGLFLPKKWGEKFSVL